MKCIQTKYKKEDSNMNTKQLLEKEIQDELEAIGGMEQLKY